eukprot:symbB.v1.2.034255.t1/scaffold4393.1/size40249/3
MTAPNGPSQQACILQSMREAGNKARDINLAECHGTGTALGDPIEVGALKNVMEPRDTTLALTSSKSNIGHLEGSAGIAGFLKCVSMLMAGTCPPNAHCQQLNPHLQEGVRNMGMCMYVLHHFGSAFSISNSALISLGCLSQEAMSSKDTTIRASEDLEAHLQRLHEESMAKLAYAWNPPDMDPRNVTLRGAAVDIDPAEESTREESTREGSHELQELEIKESPVKPQDVEVQSCSSEEVCACWWEKTNKRPKRKISRAVTGLALGATFY